MIQLPARDKTYYQSLRLSSAPPAAEPFGRATLNIEEESFVEVLRLLGADDNRNISLPGSQYGIQVQEEGGGSWFSDYVCSNLFFTPGANPRRLLTPIVLSPNAVLNVQYRPTGLTATYNAFDLALEGVRRPTMTREAYARIRQRPYYAYVTPFGQNLTGSGSLKLEFETAIDSTFVVQNLGGVGVYNNVGGAVAEFDAVKVRIFNATENDRPYSSNPIPWFQAVGQPDVWMGMNRLLSPMVWRRKSRIRVEITIDTAIGTLAGSWKSLQVGFEGFKIKE